MNTQDRNFVVAIMTNDHTFRDMRLTSIGGGADEVTMLISFMFIHIFHPSYIPSLISSILQIFHPSYISSFIYLFNHIFVLVLHHLHHCPSFCILSLFSMKIYFRWCCKSSAKWWELFLSRPKSSTLATTPIWISYWYKCACLFIHTRNVKKISIKC